VCLLCCAVLCCVNSVCVYYFITHKYYFITSIIKYFITSITTRITITTQHPRTCTCVQSNDQTLSRNIYTAFVLVHYVLEIPVEILRTRYAGESMKKMHGGSRTSVRVCGCWTLDTADSTHANFQIDLLPTPFRFSFETVLNVQCPPTSYFMSYEVSREHINTCTVYS